MNWRLLLTLVLLVAAAVSGWSVWTHRPERRVVATAEERSDYTLHDFELVVLDKQGRESFTLRAPELTRSPGDRTMSLATPLFLIPGSPDTSNTGWEVRSRTGWVSAGATEVRLRGNVEARTMGTPTRPTTVRTEQLNLFPDANRATSATPVTLTQPGSILRGQGMTLLLDSRRVQFASNVKVRYVPSGR